MRVAIEDFGELVWDEKEGSIGCHCFCHKKEGLCRTNRKLIGNEKRSPYQGRPLGFLVAWLRSCRELSREKHQKLAKRGGQYDPEIAQWIPLERRQNARDWLESQPEMKFWLTLERGLRDGEPCEPVVVAY